MTHDQAQPLLLDVAYGELPSGEAREVELHAAGCARCAAELAELLATRRLVGRLADEPVPVRGRAELAAAARRAVAPAPVRRPARARVYAIAASAAVIALAVGVTLRWSGQRPAWRAGETAPEQGDLAPLEDVAPRVVPGPPAPAPSLAPVSVPAPVPAPVSVPAPARGPALKQQPASSAARPRAAQLDGARAQRGAAAAPQAAAPAEAEAGAGPAGEPPGIVDDIERRAAAGELRQERRLLTCEGAALERVALLAGDRVVKLTVRPEGEAVHEGWYDGAGELRAVRQSAAGEGARESSLAPSRALPSRAPAEAALSRCAW